MDYCGHRQDTRFAEVLSSPLGISPPKISINTSPARNRFVVRSPTSPAKSITGAIMDSSQYSNVDSSSSKTDLSPSSPVNDAAMFRRHAEHKHDSDQTPVLQNNISRSRGHSLDFFDSDSSEIEQPRMPANNSVHYDDPFSGSLPFEFRLASGRAALNVDVLKHGRNRIPTQLNNEQHKRLSGTINTAGYFHALTKDETPDQAPASVDVGGTAQLDNQKNFVDQFFLQDASNWDVSTFEGLDTQQAPDPIVDIPCESAISSSGPTQEQKRDNEDGILNLYQMMLQANNTAFQIALREKSVFRPLPRSFPEDGQQQSIPLGSEPDFVRDRPRRPVSDHGSFVANANSRNGGKRPRTVPNLSSTRPPGHISPYGSQAKSRRSLSSPPTADRHVHVAPLPLASQDLEHRNFVANATRESIQSMAIPPIPPTPNPIPQHNLHFVTPSTTDQNILWNDDHALASHMLSDFSQQPATELLIFVRRRHAPRGYRMTRIVIPRDFRVAKSTLPLAVGTNEKHFRSLDFDDCVLFNQMRNQYYGSLLGTTAFARFCASIASAKALRNIKITDLRPQECGSNTNADFCGYEDEQFERGLMRMFHSPSLAKDKYAWVQWAQNLNASQDGKKMAILRVPTTSGERHSIDPEQSMDRENRDAGPGAGISPCYGLEFVEEWSFWRILFISVVVIIASVAVCLLWIFLGPPVIQVSNGMEKQAEKTARVARAARVLPGCVLSLLVFVFSCVLMCLWAVASYLL